MVLNKYLYFFLLFSSCFLSCVAVDDEEIEFDNGSAFFNLSEQRKVNSEVYGALSFWEVRREPTQVAFLVEYLDDRVEKNNLFITGKSEEEFFGKRKFVCKETKWGEEELKIKKSFILNERDVDNSLSFFKKFVLETSKIDNPYEYAELIRIGILPFSWRFSPLSTYKPMNVSLFTYKLFDSMSFFSELDGSSITQFNKTHNEANFESMLMHVVSRCGEDIGTQEKNNININPLLGWLARLHFPTFQNSDESESSDEEEY